MSKIKEYLRETRRQSTHYSRTIKDNLNGSRKYFATASNTNIEYPIRISLTQKINPSQSLTAKLNNLRLGINKINNAAILPGQIFSFWFLIGRASKENGYEPSRTIMGNEVIYGYGGGLCQLSGIIHHVSLLAGLEIIERHQHTIDIYTEEERFCPLGSDATVSYGFKDLRIRNDQNFPVQFRLEMTDTSMTAHICSPETITERIIEFKRSENNEGQLVQTYDLMLSEPLLLAKSFYLKQKGRS